MTVAELITCLGSFPPDLPVYVGDWVESYRPDAPLEEDQISVEPQYDSPKPNWGRPDRLRLMHD